MAEAEILAQREAPEMGPDGRWRIITVVTYQTPALPPRDVTIPKTDPTDDEISAAIRADIERAAAQAPRRLTF